MSRIRANLITNQSADGSPTVQDGLVISGVTTSTSFSGSGASLTNLNASNIASGTVPTARLGSGTANSSTFLAGDSTFKTVTGTTINNNANNRVITGSGTANTLEGEANLQFDGTNIGVGVAPSGVSNYSTIHLKGQTSGNGGAVRLTDYGDTPDSDDFTIYKNSSAGYLRINGTDPLIAYMNGAERVRITSGGYVGINQSNPVRPLHITGNDGSSGATSGNSDTTMILDNAGTNGSMIEFLNANNGAGHLMFTDTDASNSGRISYHHNGDYFRFDTSGTERLRINSNGQTTIPSQPSFAAYKAANSFTQSGVIVFDATKHNIGSHYSTSNGRFTAPVAGRYQFTFWSIILGQYSSAYYSIRINGSAGRGMYVHITQTHNGWDNTCTTWILDLNASDYVDLNSNSSINWHGNDWQLFSGQLLS